MLDFAKNIVGLLLFAIGSRIVGASMSLITDKTAQKRITERMQKAWTP
jgi:hypothetical protein